MFVFLGFIAVLFSGVWVIASRTNDEVGIEELAATLGGIMLLGVLLTPLAWFVTQRRFNWVELTNEWMRIRTLACLTRKIRVEEIEQVQAHAKHHPALSIFFTREGVPMAEHVDVILKRSQWKRSWRLARLAPTGAIHLAVEDGERFAVEFNQLLKRR